MRSCIIIVTILYNFIRLLIKKVIFGGRLKSTLVQMISPKASLSILPKGKITIKGRCTVEQGSKIKASSGEIELEDGVYINRNCNIVSHEGIFIKKGVTIGPNVCIYDHDHNFKLKNIKAQFITSPIIIEENVWIGAGAIILKGVVIGKNSIIGAGTIVTKSIPEDSIVTTKNDLIVRHKIDKY